ncbi:MAG: heparinase, partial [Opitutaceae bacterium]
MLSRLFLIWTLVAVVATGADAARTYGGFYTAERLARGRHHAADSAWGRALRDAVVKKAKPWLARSDAELWALVPGQALGRCIDVTLDRRMTENKRLGCLQCGARIFAYGSYPYSPDVEHQTWKLTCPSCGAVFPTNDFGRYYRSAIDEHGVFNPAKGDRRLLYNTAHPDPHDPLHLFGVDDGYGYVDSAGREYRFIGYYTWKHWVWLQDGLKALADAFVDTGDRRYAHKAAVLLDRIADLYPAMDFKPYADRGWYHSDGNRGRGKIEGAIWETNVLRKLAEDYDAVLSGTVGDARLFAFLAQQGHRYKLPHLKGTRDLFVQNVDEGILRCGFTAVTTGQVSGNEGMQQLTVAACALALNTMPESGQWLDWIFAPTGGALPGLLTELLDHDGMSNEAAPGYAHFLGQCLAETAFRLADYPRYTRHDIFREFPQLLRTFTAEARTAVFGLAVPNLGDTGATGVVSKGPISVEFMAKGYRYTHDADAAIAAWRMNGGSAQGLGRDLLADDPGAEVAAIERLGRAAGPLRAEGDLLTGFGLAELETGTAAAGFALACNYGRTINHG